MNLLGKSAAKSPSTQKDMNGLTDSSPLYTGADEQKKFNFHNGTVTYSIWYCDDIKIGHTISNFKECFNNPAWSKNDVVRLHFGLRGDYQFSCKQLNKSFDLVGGHHNILYSNGVDMVVRNKSLELETFGIQFPKDQFIQFTQNSQDLLDRFSQNILRGKSVLLTDKWGVIDARIEKVIRQITHCKYTGELKRTFLLSKSIELLVLSSESFWYASPRKETDHKPLPDTEKIIAARELIDDRISNPPSLSEIAGAVDLNEYILKRDFKATFQVTIFDYLTEQRLCLAHQYLRNTKQTVEELSDLLGYVAPEYFTFAFKKKFGLTPESIRSRN